MAKGEFPNKATQFSRSNQPEKNGRKKNIYTILAEKGYSQADIKTAFSEMAWYTLEELGAVHADESKPVIMRLVANQFYKALKLSDWGKIKDILEHVLGRPKQEIDQKIDTQPTIQIINHSTTAPNEDYDSL